MKKATLIIIISAGIVLSAFIALFVIFCFVGDGTQAPFTALFFKNTTETSYGSISVKLKEGYDYDLSDKKYFDCSFCGCCEEGTCDWHCEAAYDLGFDVSCGCYSESISLFDFATFTFPETLPIDEIYHDSILFNKEDVFAVYVHIAKKLTDKESLKDHEIIELANHYKKLSETIDVYQQSDSSFIDSLSEMPELYGDMRSDIQKLLFDREIVLSLSYLHKDVEKFLVDACIEVTGTCPLEKLSVVCIQDEPGDYNHYVFSDEGYCYLSLLISVDSDSWNSYLSYSPSLTYKFSEKEIEEMLEMAVSITDTKSKIPVYPVD